MYVPCVKKKKKKNCVCVCVCVCVYGCVCEYIEVRAYLSVRDCACTWKVGYACVCAREGGEGGVCVPVYAYAYENIHMRVVIECINVCVTVRLRSGDM